MFGELAKYTLVMKVLVKWWGVSLLTQKSLLLSCMPLDVLALDSAVHQVLIIHDCLEELGLDKVILISLHLDVGFQCVGHGSIESKL